MVPYVQSLLANFVSAYYLTTALQHGRHKKIKSFGFDLTQSQSSKPISSNGYGPNCPKNT